MCWARATLGGNGSANLQLALADCNKSLELDRTGSSFENPATRGNRGLIYLKLGRFAEARSDYDAMLTMFPSMPRGLFGRGVAKRRLGDRRGGDADIAAAKAQDPNVAREFASWGVTP
jgi:tetratricopeptide (TPR) repeat protein